MRPLRTVWIGAVLAALSAARTSSTAPPDELPNGKGKAVVERICGKCHGVETFAQLRLSPEEWRQEVAGMVARGASGTPAELKTVVRYLTRYLGKKPARRQ